MDESDFADMVEQTPVRTFVIEYREPSVNGRPGRLVGACLTDQQADGLSMIYSFFDPDPEYRPGLGTYVILDHIAAPPPPRARGSPPPTPTRDVAHLAARPRRVLAVEMQMGVVGEDRRPAMDRIADQIAHLDALGGEIGRAQRQAADRADMVLELAGDARPRSSSARSCGRAAPSR